VELPQQSFYLQQTELTEEQFSAYRDMAIQRTGKDPAVRSEIIFPTEWRDVYNLSFDLSIDDPDYDYRLPTREEWAFACMNGYDQDCPGVGQAAHEPIPANQPNKYDIQGLLNYDAECGDVPGLLLGIQYPLPSESNDVLPCRCLQFMVGNPDADDGMNELITARFVLVPQSAPTNP
jgi:hypothetical protein